MSDIRLHLVPTDPQWTAGALRVRRALRALRALVPDAEDVRAERHAEVVFVDAGGNTERIECPGCGDTLPEDWWAERMSSASEQAFRDLAVRTPCCGTVTSLNDLRYVWPAGFARLALTAHWPARDWLSADERDRVAVALGHPVREIRSRV
ncbi:hypothetical protein [Blastococcus litoris]|uniref:hypothetical protein n=1 Tax=Blastococcus litoris TaxID=2171622 RepID=UPI000E3052D5|nr:hypothetical protein [Blastococcus litoris]